MNFLVGLMNFISGIGALNWGFRVFLDFDIVRFIADAVSVNNLDKIIYGIVAFAGVFSIMAVFFA